jgi:RNA polymerase sigma-70 factor (ECF subfamily)
MNSPCFDSDELVKEHGDFLFRFAMRKVGDRFIAEDMVQDTLISAIRSQASFKGDSNIRTWLVSILKNRIIDHIRKNSRETPLPENEDDLGGIFTTFGTWSNWVFQRWSSPEADIDNSRMLVALERCISKLPTKMRAIFLCRHAKDSDSHEICAELQISQSVLDTNMFRARLLLRSCLDKNWFNKDKEAA